MRCTSICVVLLACDGADHSEEAPDRVPVDGDVDTDADVDSSPETDARTGRTYRLDLGRANWFEPEFVSSILAELLADDAILVMPAAVGAANIDWLVAATEGEAQAPCAPTRRAPSTVWQDPDFALVPIDLVLDVAAVGGVSFADVEIAGAFSPDLGRLDGVTIRGEVDTRTLVEAVEPGGADDAFCVLVSPLGADCVPCIGGGGVFCLPVGLDYVDSPYLAGVAVVERTEQDIADDPSCNPQ